MMECWCVDGDLHERCPKHSLPADEYDLMSADEFVTTSQDGTAE